MDIASLSLEEVRHRLGSLGDNESQLKHSGKGRIAAVLLAIYEVDGSSCIILTRRSKTLPQHAGQISFPGGSREAGDSSLVETALREAEEEIGLLRNKVDVMGELPPLNLPSGFWVSPVIGLLQETPTLQPDPGEVDEIFTLPLPLLFRKDLFQQGSMVRNGIKRDFYYIDYKDYYIWGATATMLFNLAAVLGTPTTS